MQFIQYQKISFFALLVLLGACTKTQPVVQGPPPVGVVVEAVKISDASYYEEYPTTIRALNEVELRAQVNGYITGISFTEGAPVKKGQTLYTVDQQAYEAAFQQARANLQVQEANLLRAKQDVERYRELGKNDAIAQQQVDYAEATYTAALQQVEASKAAVKSVQTNVRYSTITAPFDGVIGISNVRMGAAVTAGQTLLNTVSAMETMAADITVGQREIFRFNELQSTKSQKNDSTFRLAIGDRDYEASGKISVIDRAVDLQTGTIRVRIVFPNDNLILRPGMSGTLRVHTTTRNAVLIPYKAVTEQLGEFFSYVVVDGKTVTQRRLRLGNQIGRDIVVEQGLEAGETIVVEGVQSLREGAAIAIAQPAAK